jgi:hypothetical protein
MLHLTLLEGKRLVGTLQEARHIALGRLYSGDIKVDSVPRNEIELEEALRWKNIIFSAFDHAKWVWMEEPSGSSQRVMCKHCTPNTVEFNFSDTQLETILEMLREDLARHWSRFALVATPKVLEKLTEKLSDALQTGGQK